MSVNINFKIVIFVSCILLLTHETFAQKTIDPARQMDPVKSLFWIQIRVDPEPDPVQH